MNYRAHFKYYLKYLKCENDYIVKVKRIETERVKNEHSETSSQLYQQNIKGGHKIDFDDVNIFDRTSTELKLQSKEMLLIRKHNLSLNRHMNSEFFTLIIRNIEEEYYITRDIQ